MKRAFFQMHLAVLLWGFSGIFGRALSLSALVLVWYRLFLAGLILGLILVLRKKWEVIARKDIVKLSGIGMLIAIHWLCFYGSIKLANTSIAVVCLATSSVFVALLDPFINKGKAKLIEFIIGIIALLGVFSIYLLHPADGTTPELTTMKNFKLGLLLGLVAALLAALFTCLNKPFAEKYTARPLVFWEMVSGFAFLTLLMPILLHFDAHVSFAPVGWDYLWIFLLAYCCTVWGQSLAMAALKKLSAFTTTISVNLEPIYSIILAFIIFKENQELSYGFYVGMALIFASVAAQIALSLKKDKKKPRLKRATT